MAKQILPLSELENHVVIPAAFIKFGPKKKNFNNVLGTIGNI